jgi:hypothetical protein
MYVPRLALAAVVLSVVAAGCTQGSPVPPSLPNAPEVPPPSSPRPPTTPNPNPATPPAPGSPQSNS